MIVSASLFLHSILRPSSLPQSPYSLYYRLAPWLGLFACSRPSREPRSADPQAGGYEVVVIGLGRFGARICRILAVDFDKESVRRDAREGYPTCYRGFDDPEFVGSIPLEQVRWVVGIARTRELGSGLLQLLRRHRFRGKAALSANREDETGR